MRSRPVSLLALIVTVSACGGPPASPASVVPGEPRASGGPNPSTSTVPGAAGLAGQIAFVAGADPQIHLLDLASGEHRQLTSLRPEDGTPATAAGPMRPALSCGFGPFGLAWSPDGSLLAFHYGGCDAVIWVVDVDGNTRRVADGTGPSWSPDGARLIFSPNRPWAPCGPGCQGQPPAPGAWDLQVVPLAGGGEPRPLTDDGATTGGYGATWSPNGALVAFSGPSPADGADAELFTATYVLAEDGAGRRLVARGGWPFGWLPDGRLLVVDEQTGRMRAVDLATTEADPIGGEVRVDAISPDGQRLLGTVADPVTGAERGRIAELDGTTIAELDGQAATWSPDGRWVVAIAHEAMAILVHDPDGELVARYDVSESAWAGPLSWRP